MPGGAPPLTEEEKEERRVYGRWLRETRDGLGLKLLQREVALYIRWQRNGEPYTPQMVGKVEKGLSRIGEKPLEEFPGAETPDIVLPSVKQAWERLLTRPGEVERFRREFGEDERALMEEELRERQEFAARPFPYTSRARSWITPR